MPLCHQLDSNYLVPSGVLLASFLGSGHCVGMCGGLVVAVSQSRFGIILYHVGRLFGYLLLGLIFGFLGQRVQWMQSGPVSLFFAIVMGVSLILLGVYNWRDGQMHLPLPRWITDRAIEYSSVCLSRSSGQRVSLYPSMVGFMSIFLPCGWLYAFVLGALSTQSPWKGMLLMTLFWIGTLPALTLTPWIFRQLLSHFPRMTPKIASTVLIVVGLMTIVFKFV